MRSHVAYIIETMCAIATCNLHDGMKRYLSLDFEVVLRLAFFGLGVLEFAEPWPARPWSSFFGC